MTTITPFVVAYDALGTTKQDGGITIDPATGKHPTTGYAVSVEGYESRVPVWASDDTLLGILIDTAEQAKRHGSYLGTWKNDGMIVVDVTEVCDREQDALELARLWKQEAIYNLATGETIKVKD